MINSTDETKNLKEELKLLRQFAKKHKKQYYEEIIQPKNRDMIFKTLSFTIPDELIKNEEYIRGMTLSNMIYDNENKLIDADVDLDLVSIPQHIE